VRFLREEPLWWWRNEWVIDRSFFGGGGNHRCHNLGRRAHDAFAEEPRLALRYSSSRTRTLASYRGLQRLINCQLFCAQAILLMDTGTSVFWD